MGGAPCFPVYYSNCHAIWALDHCNKLSVKPFEGVVDADYDKLHGTQI
jgi:hypothetical protein